MVYTYGPNDHFLLGTQEAFIPKEAFIPQEN